MREEAYAGRLRVLWRRELRTQRRRASPSARRSSSSSGNAEGDERGEREAEEEEERLWHALLLHLDRLLPLLPRCPLLPLASASPLLGSARCRRPLPCFSALVRAGCWEE